MRIAILTIAVILCLGQICCDIFETRRPEDPDRGGSIAVPATIDTLVLYNMRNAFKEGDAEKYKGCFSSVSYVFDPTPNARLKYPGAFDGWNKQSEEDYFRHMISQLEKNSSAVLGFGQYTIFSSGYDSSRIEADYQLSIPHTKTGASRIFIGHARFTFMPQSGLWYITRWEDFNIAPSDTTWSYLKGIAYSEW